jgi:glycyl-tRNA synthetase beta chain
MRWANYSLRFARPIRWIVSLYGSEMVNFDIEGTSSGNLSKGHRTLANNDIKITSSDDYFK